MKTRKLVTLSAAAERQGINVYVSELHQGTLMPTRTRFYPLVTAFSLSRMMKVISRYKAPTAHVIVSLGASGYDVAHYLDMPAKAEGQS